MRKKSGLKVISALLLIIIAIFLGGFFWVKSIFGELWIFKPYLDEILGFNEEKNYLLIFQNNNELRPTGGFISAYGILKLKDGKYTFEFADSYKLETDKNLSPAPKPFRELLKDDPKFKGWYFRDGNFEVDFPKAAKDLERLYQEQSGQKIDFDGVFAINFEFLEDLISIYKIELDGKKLDRQNLFSFLEHEVKNIDTHNVVSLDNRKNVLKQITEELIAKTTKFISRYDDLLATTQTALHEKKILIFFKDNEIQKLVEGKKWAGSFDRNNYKNFIYTNIANIGGRKADRYIRKTHKYFVSFEQSGKAKVNYSLNFEHLGTKNLNSDEYRAFIRVFVPDGYFEEYLRIMPGEEQKFNFVYELPKEIEMDNFVLDLIKQPGTKDLWQIAIQSSADNSLTSNEFETHENVTFFTDFLLRDKHFDFEYHKDKLPPLVLWQQFNTLNEIEIGWNENLNQKSALNPNNYEISDNVEIKNVSFKDMRIFLETEGVEEANEKKYKITLKNIEDSFGNKITPNPMEITVVQRL